MTFLTSLTFATIGTVIAYITNLMIIIPILFGIGIPIVNIDKPLLQKIGLTIVIVFVSIGIFFLTIWAALSFDFDKYILPGFLAGLAGIAILGINGLIIETIKLNFKSITLTFLLSGLSIPFWIILRENNFPTTIINIEFVGQFGGMLFWMTLTTIGVCLSFQTETKNEAN